MLTLHLVLIPVPFTSAVITVFPSLIPVTIPSFTVAIFSLLLFQTTSLLLPVTLAINLLSCPLITLNSFLSNVMVICVCEFGFDDELDSDAEDEVDEDVNASFFFTFIVTVSLILPSLVDNVTMAVPSFFAFTSPFATVKIFVLELDQITSVLVGVTE